METNPVNGVARRPCVFFDRDGIVNVAPVETRYVMTPETFHLHPEFLTALEQVNRAGYAAVVVTNQKGVGTGVLAEPVLEAIHQVMWRAIGERGLALDDLLISPFTEDAHPWRKPNPGMLLEAAERHGLDLARSWMVGDNESDVVAGARAGCRTIRVGSADAPSEATHHLASMADLPDLLDRILDPP